MTIAVDMALNPNDQPTNQPKNSFISDTGVGGLVGWGGGGGGWGGSVAAIHHKEGKIVACVHGNNQVGEMKGIEIRLYLMGRIMIPIYDFVLFPYTSRHMYAMTS